MSRFHRLESYYLDDEQVVCSFDTTQHGYYQVACDGDQVTHLANEPDPMMLRGNEWEEIQRLSHIIYRMVYDTKSPKEVFRNV